MDYRGHGLVLPAFGVVINIVLSIVPNRVLLIMAMRSVQQAAEDSMSSVRSSTERVIPNSQSGQPSHTVQFITHAI